MIDHPAADRWLRDYVAAWRSYDAGAIAALFTEDVVYRYHPWDEPVRGRDAVLRSWTEAPDPPGTYDGEYRTRAVDGDTVVATGSSLYRDAPDGPVTKSFDNCFVMRFAADGRCREFTEWYMRRPAQA